MTLTLVILIHILSDQDARIFTIKFLNKCFGVDKVIDELKLIKNMLGNI